MTPSEILPEPGRGVRWTAGRKAAVVKAIAAGTISPSQALRDYDISPAELESWQAAFGDKGRHGLKVKSIPHNRRPQWPSTK